MSILNALKQQDGSIDELARLPQTMIMQMAQRKEINAEMVAPILARKAQMADAVARTKALQKGGAPMPSVMEQLMQKTADQENPEPEPQAENMGVAQLPIPERNYAGGGIVAFADGGEAEDTNLPPQREGESDNAYMNRVRAVQEAGSQFFNPRNYNPLAKLSDLYNTYQENIGQPVAAAVNRFTNESPESQAARFNAAKQQPRTVQTPAAPTAVETQAGPTKVEPTKPGITSLAQKPAAETRAQSTVQKPTASTPEVTEPKQDAIDAMLAKYEKLISGDPEASAKAKKEAMWSRLLEAGLGTMGGTSQYALTNIGQGSAQAAKGYAEDVKGIRAEEQAKLTQLMGLGLKGATLKQEAQKMGITAKHYDDWAKVQSQQNAIMAGTRADTNAQRAETATEGRITAYAGKLLALPKYMDNPELAYADAKKAVTGQSTQPTFTGFSGRPLK